MAFVAPIEKKCYLVNRYGDVKLYEVEYYAKYIHNNLTYYVISGKNKKCIWSTNIMDVGHRVTYGTREIRTDVFLSLSDAEKAIKDAIDELVVNSLTIIASYEATIDRAKNADLTTIPKDEYVSPFTGKKA